MTPRDGLLEKSRPQAAASRVTPQVEIVVPVRDEERDVGPSVRRLDHYLSSRFPFSARITIADNGSTDGTWAAAVALAGEFEPSGPSGWPSPRGRALRSIWLDSDADVLAYMDVDLSTDLNALLPLVAPLVSGHSDVAIGTRLALPDLPSAPIPAASAAAPARQPRSPPGWPLHARRRRDRHDLAR
jgi:glycosyltransferase involved in cell wall biosynthesis